MDKEQESAIKSLTGVVVDSGDGVTHIVPICDGFVLGTKMNIFQLQVEKLPNLWSK